MQTIQRVDIEDLNLSGRIIQHDHHETIVTLVGQDIFALA
jgi:hypothetical protein